MQTVSAAWRALEASQKAWTESKLIIAGDEYTGADIISLRVYGGLYSAFGIGNAAAREIDLAIIPHGLIPRQAKIEVFVRFSDGAAVSEWLPNGVFFFSTRSTDKITGIMTVHGCDAMLKGGTDWYDNSYAGRNWPMPVSDAVADIAQRMGVELDERTVLNPAFPVPFPAGDGTSAGDDLSYWTMRETLGYIAAANGGNWTITEEGKLLLVPAAGRADAVQLGSRIEQLEPGKASEGITGIYLLDYSGEVLGSAGTEAGRYLEVLQPWGDNAMAAAVLARLSGYIYQPYTGTTALLDPAAELGDTVTVGGITSILAQKNTTYDARCTSDISAPASDEIEDEYPYQSEQQRLVERQLAQTRSSITKTANNINLRIDGVEGQVSEIDQTVSGIRFSVSDPTAGPEGSYVTMTLTVGDNTYRGVVMIDGNVDVSGSISASELYAAFGSVANLEVNRLSTSRRIPKYLARDTSDDQYIKVEGQHIYFIQGKKLDETEQAADPNGFPLYWEQDVSGATIGGDGYPYVGGQRVFTTTSETDWPVTVYKYSELTKIAMEFDPSGRNEPKMAFGAGWNEANPDVGKGFIQKTGDAFRMWFQGMNTENGIFINQDHTHIVGLPRTTSMDFSAWDAGAFSERLDDGAEVNYTVEFDAAGNPVKISDGDGHETAINWSDANAV